MNIKDIIFAQNWIEQYRRERERVAQDTIEGQLFFRDPFRFRGGQTYFAVSDAFSWDNSLQGYSVWEDRFNLFHDSGTENILTL